MITMLLTLQQTKYFYQVTLGSQVYYFDLVVPSFGGDVQVKNIRYEGSFGLVQDCSAPQSVLDAIQDAITIVETQLLESEVDSGTLTFTGETELPAVILAGVLNNTNYRVVFTTPDGTLIRAENRTITGFDAVVGTSYGTVLDPIDVDYSVLVSTAQNSTFGGTVTFTDVDAGSVAVVFSTPLPTTSYRVVLSPDGFFTASISNKTVGGFTINIGITLAVGEMVDVGFDVFAG